MLQKYLSIHSERQNLLVEGKWKDSHEGFGKLKVGNERGKIAKMERKLPRGNLPDIRGGHLEMRKI